MKREYKNVAEAGGASFFTGVEVEKTPTQGMDTLFVVGIQEVDAIIQMALQRNIKAIYFGANHSFDLPDQKDWNGWPPWVGMISSVLKDPALFWCSLDFDLSYQELYQHPKFLPQLSIVLFHVL